MDCSRPLGGLRVHVFCSRVWGSPLHPLAWEKVLLRMGLDEAPAQPPREEPGTARVTGHQPRSVLGGIHMHGHFVSPVPWAPTVLLA